MQLLTGLLVICAVHAITSFMVRWLPDAAVIALGILGGDARSVHNYWSNREPVSYVEQLARLFRGDLGNTLDHSRVLDEISVAVSHSALPLLVGVLIALLLSNAALHSKDWTRQRLSMVVDTVSLLPPFVFPFLFAPILYSSPWVYSSAAQLLALFASIVVPLTIMTTSMLLRFRDDACNEHYNRMLRLNGISTADVTRLNSLSAQSRVFALFDRIVVAAMVSIVLAEPLLGVPGIGTLSARAIKTADPNLTVAISTFIAVVVVSSGVLSTWLRTAFAALSLSRRY